MAESKLRELSTDFPVKIIKFCDMIKGHYSLVNQLEHSVTSIGANIHEANYAHGKPVLIAKLQNALLSFGNTYMRSACVEPHHMLY